MTRELLAIIAGAAVFALGYWHFERRICGRGYGLVVIATHALANVGLAVLTGVLVLGRWP